VFQERGVICEEVQRFEDLLMQQRELFAEEEIRNSFPKLIAFVLAVRITFIEGRERDLVKVLYLSHSSSFGISLFFFCLMNWIIFSFSQTEKLLNDAAATGSGAVSLDENEVEGLVS
jgi:hypothetical protein